MSTAAAVILATWALAIVVLSWQGATGRRATTSINGMRRRRPGESDQAWTAGLRALLPFQLAAASLFVTLAVAVVLVPERFFYAVLLGGLATVLGGIAALNHASRRITATSSAR